MDDGDARHSVTIRAEEDSFIEYFPDPVILFPMARMYARVVVQMHPTATVLMTDSFTSHDPMANQENFTEYRNETRVESFDGSLLCLDRYSVSGTQFSSGQLGVMGKNSVQGTFTLLNSTHPAAQLCAMIRRFLESGFDGYAGLSALPNECGIWMRLIALDAFTLRLAIQEVWTITRQTLLGERPNCRKK